MRFRADHRSIDVEFDPACEVEALAIADEFRASSLRMARALATVERKGIHVVRGYANVRDYAVHRLNLSGSVATTLVALGRRLDEPAAPRDRSEVQGAERDSGAGSVPSAGSVPGAGSDLGAGGGTEADGFASVPDPSLGDAGNADSGDRSGADAGPSGDPDSVGGSAPTSLPAEPPTFEDRVRDGTLSMANAGEFDRLARALGELSPEEHARWTQLAVSASEWKFAQLVRTAIEEAAQGAPTVSLRLRITESARRDFQRARVLASRKAQTALTEGQVFAVVLRRFVREEDALESGEKKRRTPDTRLLPGRRYVPAAVERAVLRRGEDRCEVGDCSNNTFLQLMHVRRAHALGGSREVDDLAAGCSKHHVAHDAGLIRFVGFDARRKPLFRTRGGRLLQRATSPDDPTVETSGRTLLPCTADP